ncbi:MAG: TonB-dependent receptor [Steroidobacteraceae bacterium]
MAASAQAQTSAESLEEIIVSATLRATPVVELPQSVTVLQKSELEAAGVQHLADVLGLVPDLGAAGGTSRPRYYQLRGIGEQEQYQGAPNPSVGFLIDDIDFSGAGMPATLFDVSQVEVLRGPQGSAYGANALAGLISVHSADPGADFNGRAEATLGDYDTRAAALALGDRSADGDIGWRVSAQQYRSDGYRHNAYLHRDDTNGYDEGVLRGKLLWKPGDVWQWQLSALHADIDDGYDAWSLDGSRTTLSDQPGRDAQFSNGAALKGNAQLGFGMLTTTTSAARSKIVFSYDGDWANDSYWASRPDCAPDPSQCVPYDYFSITHRTRRTLAEDLRLAGDGAHTLPGGWRWLAGVYALRFDEDLDQHDYYNGALYTYLQSAYRATSLATYGQLDKTLAPGLELSAGARVEQRDAHYTDSDGGAALAPSNTMAGGNVSLSWQQSTAQRWYATLARGYKAGGFNLGSSIPDGKREFKPEYLWNLEFGVKRGASGDALQLQADVFYMWRVDEQVSTSVQLDPSDPLSYGYLTDNAASGTNYGLEGSAAWNLAPAWTLGGSLSLLRARYRDFSYEVVNYDSNGNAVVATRNLSGREQEYAPSYRASLYLAWHSAQGWYARLDGQAVDSYYFSASHDQRAPAYQLMNARLGWASGAWDASLWGRNLFDAYYALHGFYFGNEPPYWENKRYIQAGDPRTLGVTLRYSFGAQ